MDVRKSKKNYIINLNSRRSKRALIAAIIAIAATFVAVVDTLIQLADGGADETFKFFTVLSCMLSALGALFMIPYAVEGIRKKRFSMPKWVSMFQYSGAVAVFITMICSATLILATYGFYYAFGGASFWMHLVAPISSLVLFLAVESGHILTKKDMIIAQIPYWLYGILYSVMVVLIGEENGGWRDFYKATSIIPLWVVVPMLLAVGFGSAILLRWFHNRMVEKERRELLAQWPEDISPVELRIEAFGLGRYMASNLDKNEVVIPLDILTLMAEKGGMSADDLVKAYSKGIQDGGKEGA